MRKVLLIAFAMLLSASVASATPAGALQPFQTQAGVQCNLSDLGAFPFFNFSVYVIHYGVSGDGVTTGVGGSEWWAPFPSCMGSTIWGADSDPTGGSYAIFGNSQDAAGGVSIGYGACLTGLFTGASPVEPTVVRALPTSL